MLAALLLADMAVRNPTGSGTGVNLGLLVAVVSEGCGGAIATVVGSSGPGEDTDAGAASAGARRKNGIGATISKAELRLLSCSAGEGFVAGCEDAVLDIVEGLGEAAETDACRYAVRADVNADGVTAFPGMDS